MNATLILTVKADPERLSSIYDAVNETLRALAQDRTVVDDNDEGWIWRSVVWAEDGDFDLSDSSRGNPGCDRCGELDAVVKLDDEYLCPIGAGECGIQISENQINVELFASGA